jgi:3-oxoacyl-[acyl-carrier protein] reductase
MRLRGKVAIITGGSRGIGRATALAFGREGANVVVNFRKNPEKAQEVVEQLQGMGRNALSFEADVSNISAVEAMVEATLRELGTIHILVNNAGITLRKGIQETSEKDWDRVMAVNLKGSYNCLRAVGKHMMERRYGKIVNISSADGVGVANTKNVAYACSKAAVVQLTKTAALELGRYNINVNCIAPGLTETDIIREERTEEEVRAIIEQTKKLTVLQRIAKPEDIANVAVFLSSDESSFITGKIILADGGRFNFM